jgi:hypothetical protein
MVQNQAVCLVLGVFFFQRNKPFHQATFSPGGVVTVYNALLGGLIQGADSLERGSAGFFQTAVLDQVFRFPDEGARPAAMHAVAQAPPLVLLVAFYS